ncbi:MAG: hypothetical protein M9924_21690 [Rhizobiaceae bacterium]|nr:hypothetical protein [Rhizobiaceae bacterium]
MSSIAPINTSVLQLFQQFNRPDAAKQPTDAGNSILKAANGVSVEASAGTKSAAAAIGKFTVDAASSDKPLGYTLVIGDLGTFNTWEEAKAYVNANDDFSTSEKKDWLEKLDGFAKGLEEFKKIQASDLYQSFMSGAMRDEWLALQKGNKEGLALSPEHVDSMDKFLSSLGRETLTESLSRAPNSILPKSSAT